MAALVAYPVASPRDRVSRRQRTPLLSRTGWDEEDVLLLRGRQELEYDVVCGYLQRAILAMFPETCRLDSAGRDQSPISAGSPQQQRKQLKVPQSYIPPHIACPDQDRPSESVYTHESEEARAQCSIELPVRPPVSNRTRSSSGKSPTPSGIDFSAQNFRAHAKKKANKKAQQSDPWADDNKKDEPAAGDGNGDAGAGDGAAGGSGGGAGGGDDGNGGDDKGGDDGWDDWSGAKKKNKKSKKKQDEEEEEQQKKQKEAEKDEWAGVGGEDEWGGWGAKASAGGNKKKTTEDPTASTNAWADTAGGGGGAEDENWDDFTTGGKKKKNKKKQADEAAKPADDSFHEIKLDDEQDLGVPKISLSFDDPAAAAASATKKEESGSGFGFSNWSSSWSFGGLGGGGNKKEEEKEASSAKGGNNGDSGKKQQQDDEDDFLPAWGAGAGSTGKKDAAKEKKNSKFGIEELDDPPAAAKQDDNTWGGWGKKSAGATKTEAATDSWSGWSSGATAKKDAKKKTGASWADLVEEEDDTTALPVVGKDKKTEDSSWGMWGTDSKKKGSDDVWAGFGADSKKDKTAKPAIEEVKADDLTVLNGLFCERDGKLLDSNGDAIAELYEGDATTIARRMYTCNDKGEFKDKKFKVIGRARLLFKEPAADAAPDASAAAAADADAPPITALEGLCCERDGTIKDYGGAVIGQVTEGDPAEFSSKMYFCDGKGNVCDYKNKPVGKCTTVGPGGAAKKSKDAEKPKDDDVWGWAATSGKSAKVPPPPKGPAKADKKKDDDIWGTWGTKTEKKVEEEMPTEAEGGADEGDISILDGRVVDADGKIYDDDNNPIGECTDGDVATIARRQYKVNKQGEIVSRMGKVLGHCKLLPQPKKDEPAAEEAQQESTKDEPAASTEPPPLSDLKGRTIESDGTILNADGEVIGEVTEGDPERFASIAAKCDGNGNILNSKKKVVGKCKTVAPQSVPATEAPSEAAAAAEESEPPPPPPAEDAKPKFGLADLMGRKIESNGDVLDDDFNVVAKVVEGNAKQLAKKGAICDAAGNAVLGKKTLGKVELLVPEVPDEPEPAVAEEDAPAVAEDKPAAKAGPTLEMLNGRKIEADGSVLDDDGSTVIARVIDGKVKQMIKKMATCNENGEVVFGFSVIGKVELVLPEGGGATEDAPPEDLPPPPPPPPEAPKAAAEPPDYSILDGKFIEHDGTIVDDNGDVIARLVEGNASKLYKGNAKCDGQGHVIMKRKIQEDAKVELVLPDKVAEDEAPAAVEEEPPAEEASPFAKLDGRPIEKNGDILDASGELIALLVKGSASKLYKAGATCDANGKVWAKNKEVDGAEVQMLEVEKKDEEPAAPEPPPAEEEEAKPEESPFAKLDGRRIEKNGDILDDEGNVLAMLKEGNASKLYKAAATCDAEGKVWSKGKEVKDAKVELLEIPEDEPAAPAEEVPEEPAAAKEPEKPTFASIEGKLLDKFGEICNDDNVVVARLVEGSAGTLYKKGAYCDADGNVIVNGKKQKTAKLELVVFEDIPEPEPEPVKEAEPEPVEEEKPAEASGLTLASLEGLMIDRFGDVYDNDNKLVARLVEGSASKLAAKAAVCGADGSVKAGSKTIKNARVELVEQEAEPEPEPEAEPEPEPEATPEPPSLAILDGKPIDKSGDIFDDSMNVIGRLVEGDAKKLARAGATCDAEGQVWAKKKIVAGARVEVVEQEKPADEEPQVIDLPPPPPPPPAPKELTMVDLDGRAINEDGNVLDDNGVVIGKLVGETKKLKAIYTAGGTCDANGDIFAKGKKVPKVSVELVLPEPPAEPEPEPEPEPKPEPEPVAPPLDVLDGRKLEENGDILDDDGKVIGRLVEGTDKLKLLFKNKATCDAEGKLWAKGKQVPRTKVETVAPVKEEDPPAPDAVKDLLDSIDNPDDAWGDPWASSKDKKGDDKALTRITSKSSKASKDDTWDSWGSASKKDKKKDDPKIMKAEAVDEPDAKKDDDAFGFAFTNKRDKKSSKKKDLIEAVEDDDAPLQKAEVIEEHKSSQEDDPDWAFASNRVKNKKAAEKAGTKTSTKSSAKAIEGLRAPSPPDKVKAIEAAPEEAEEDELAPDDSASVAAPKSKKDEKTKSSGGWGGFFGRSSSTKTATPTLAQLRKEREEREQKDSEERAERERVEAEQAEKERLEQEERDRALKEAEDAEKARKTLKKGKKVSSSSKAKVEEPLPPPPPPPPPAPIKAVESEAEDEAGGGAKDAFSIWGVKRKPAKATNEKASLKADGAKKTLESAGDEVLPIANAKSVEATSSSKMAIKSSSSKSKGNSIADRIKALQGETKLKDDAPPVPPPPPPAAPLDDSVPDSTKKSKKSTSASKSAAKSSAKKEPEPEPVIKKKELAPGGFPDSDDDLLIDLEDTKLPTPEPDMGAKVATKSTKKVSSSKTATKSSKTPTKTKSKVVEKKIDSGSETEAEPAVTQGSGSTTAVDDQQVVDGKLPTPPPEDEKRKSTSPTTRKERPKVVRGSTGSAWGFWGTSGAKDARPRTKDAPATTAKRSTAPMATRDTKSRRSATTDNEKSENEKKTPSKPTPKRASTFSIFGPTPTRRQSTRSAPKSSSRPQSMSRRASPDLLAGDFDDDNNDEIPRVSSKAAKMMGMKASAGASASRRASTKSKVPKDPYALPSDDDEDGEVMLDNGLDIYAVDSPAVPARDRRSKRKSVAEAEASAKDDDLLVDGDPSLDSARGADIQDPPATSRRQSPSKQRSVSRSVPRKSEGAGGGIMGLFGLRRSNTTKEAPRNSEPTFGIGKLRKDGYDTDAGYRRSSKRSAEGADADAPRRDRRERRKSRREVDDDGFVTDAPGAQTDYEEAERRRAERRAARRAEKERLADEARAIDERAARRRDRDADQDGRRAARREREEARIQEEVDRRRRAEKEERRAARKAREEDRQRQDQQSRADDEARAAKEERRAARRRDREQERGMRDTDVERPRGERRKSSYMDASGADESKRRSSRRESRRLSKAAPVDDYFDPRNAENKTSGTPYLGSGGDKTSSWVESVNKEPPLPLAPEDTATVLEPTPEDEEDHGEESEEEIRRRMHNKEKRREKRDSHRDSGELREERDREERRRERRRRDRDQQQPSDADNYDRERRRRSSYYPDQPAAYPDYNAVPERPQASKRTSWLKKIPIKGQFF